MNDLELAVCGLNCTLCPLYLAVTDIDMRKFLAKEMKLPPELCKCTGCRCDKSEKRSKHCYFKACCQETKKLHNCSQCDEFFCDHLHLFSGRDNITNEAFKRLKRLREENTD